MLHGVFPSKWKVSNVCPVFKNGDKQSKSNYRPIALLSSVLKCLEKIVFKRIYEFLIENNLLIENNSGFKRNDSTINLLVIMLHKIYKSIDEGNDICAIFLDVLKAFDNVWHGGLFFRLKQLGICGNVLNWILSQPIWLNFNIKRNGNLFIIEKCCFDQGRIYRK